MPSSNKYRFVVPVVFEATEDELRRFADLVGEEWTEFLGREAQVLPLAVTTLVHRITDWNPYTVVIQNKADANIETFSDRVEQLMREEDAALDRAAGG